MSYVKDNLNYLPYEYIICTSGLTELFDYDIENFKYIVKYLYNDVKGQMKMKKGRRVTDFTSGGEFMELAKQSDINTGALLLSIEKMASLQYISRDYVIYFDESFDPHKPSADADEWYKLTKEGELLKKFISKINV